jgi:outer membrane protein assembly factor BamB
MLRQIITTILLITIFTTMTLAENWPRFRGPTGQGTSTETNLPTKWSQNENIAWKTEIPGESWSSPIVWNDKVFVTTATEAGTSCRVLCLNREDGKFLWNVEVFKQPTLRKEGRNSYATPTPCTDGQAVYAVFGGGSIAALDFSGKTLWTNHDVEFYSQHGLGASPILYSDLLIMPFDHSAREGERRVGWQIPWDKSFILALDTKTGKQRWKAMRGQSRIAHVTPNITDVGGKPQLVSGAGDVIQGYNPDTGAKLWEVKSQGEGVVPSIVIGDGLAYSVSGFEKPTIRAVHLDPAARGDITATHLVWEQKKNVPNIPSLLLANNLLFSITDAGRLTCMDPKTGEIIWEENLRAKFAPSPVYADGKVYLLSEEGETTVFEAAREFKPISKNPLNERCQASPAISNGNLFIRTEKNLYCVGE